MNEQQLDDALKSWPLADVPPGFSKSVMKKIEARQPDARMIGTRTLKFRITWMDLALGMFISLLPVVAYAAYTTLPRKTLLYLKYDWLLLQSPGYAPVMWALAAAALMLVLFGSFLSLRYLFSRQMRWL